MTLVLRHVLARFARQLALPDSEETFERMAGGHILRIVSKLGRARRVRE